MIRSLAGLKQNVTEVNIEGYNIFRGMENWLWGMNIHCRGDSLNPCSTLPQVCRHHLMAVAKKPNWRLLNFRILYVCKVIKIAAEIRFADNEFVVLLVVYINYNRAEQVFSCCWWKLSSPGALRTLKSLKFKHQTRPSPGYLPSSPQIMLPTS